MEELCNGENTPFGIFNADGERRKSSLVSIPAPVPRMSLSTIPIDPVLLNNGGTHFRSFEEIQYLSRQVYHVPPMPVAALNASGPISTVEDFTACQWMKYINRQPLDVDPIFAVAPQSEYYGRAKLLDGQILHRSSAANVLLIFRNRAMGRPYTLACHEFTFHLAAPNDLQKARQLELCYPSDAQMKEAMASMAPADALEWGEVMFPKHATKEWPPMLPLFQRAKVDLELPENMFRMHAVRENELMNERSATMNPALVSRLTAIKSEEKAGLETVVDVQKSLEDESLERDQDQFVLRLECGSSSLTDSNGSLPELEEVGSLSDMGICPYCFDRQHASVMECPLQGISEAMADQLNGMTQSERQAFLIKWLESHSSDVLLLPNQSPAVLQSAFEDFVKQNTDTEENKEKKPLADPRITIDRTSAPPPVFWAGNLSAAACVVPPSLTRRGQVVTQETWSSSSPSPQDSTDESFEFRLIWPNPTQSPTSLDFSLPSPLKAEPLSQEEDLREADLFEQDAHAESSAMGRNSGSKRKVPDNQKGQCQRAFTFKATGILDTDVIRKFAGVQLATIETARRMEDIVWKLYGISEQSFPTELFCHLLLHEYELAKMLTILDVLRRNGRSRMASNLHNLLAICLRDDYAVPQLLNARFLDTNYPEFGEDYHELLHEGTEAPMPPPVATPPADEHESDANSEMFEFSDGEDYEALQGWDYFRVAHSV
ncbi:hypothetical protein DFH08DRAFT_1047594 [Mycena albidolilacea]|uniref:Uncharacterized protein n=1 Tax=Mycena albidolilacea TaxID=1033008 RepID=A0AAD7AF69_9AGAR|nr:hypothetical protein DFH08DRAFT_1047594 [Mycena albidolilacea]